MNEVRRFGARLIAAALCALLLLSLLSMGADAGESAASNLGDDTASEGENGMEIASFVDTTTAILTQDEEGGQEIVLESYLTNLGNTAETIQPCDIIFVLDQSKWMNTDTDNGAQRAAIISELRVLLNALVEPTDGSEHRVAIAGYGRLNMNANTDPYDASIYPGTRASGSNISLNTGYYTTTGFLSQNGWTDLSQSDISGLPQMDSSYREAMTYENAFMTVDEAIDVLDEDTMLAWYAGASRMDAGLTIAEALADLATAQADAEGRTLMVCFLTSSLPIQNNATTNTSVIRSAAVLNASQQLKDEGAIIFGFGNYHASGKTISGSVPDTEDTFVSIMQQVCTKPEYFVSFSDFDNATDALNELLTEIVFTAASDAEEAFTLQVSELTQTDGETTQTVTWQSLLENWGDSADAVLNDTMAQVQYYYFTGYDEDWNPIFEDTPYLSFKVPLSELSQDGTLTYDATLIPLPVSVEEGTTALGSKVTITISSPYTVTYCWAQEDSGAVPASAQLPDTEYVIRDAAHTPAAVATPADAHYAFVGWYTDAECTNAYTGTDHLTGNLTLYGKWERYVRLQYFWDIWSDAELTWPDQECWLSYQSTPEDFVPQGAAGYRFDGWFLDRAWTQPYTPQPLTEDLALYARWSADPDTPYTVVYYQQDAALEGYEEVDSEILTGQTDTDIAQLDRTYDGFALSYITYEDSDHTAQSEALPIAGDGSLVVRVYYDRVLPWSLQVIKTDASGEQLLSGAIFALYLPEASEETDAVESLEAVSVAQQLTVGETQWYLSDLRATASDGSILWSDLTDQICYLLEVKAPSGYVLGDTPGQEITAEPGATVRVAVTNAASDASAPSVGIVDADFVMPLAITLLSALALVVLGVLKFRSRHK